MQKNSKEANKKCLIQQMAGYVIAGGLCFAIDYGLLLFLKEVFGLHYLIASGISYTTSIIINYFISIRFVYNVAEGKKKGSSLIAYVILGVIGLCINQFLMCLFTGHVGIDYRLSKFFAICFVAIYNFTSRKIYLER